MTAVLPPARVAIAGNAPPSREWYRYFQSSTQVNLDVGTLRHDVDALTVRVTALEDATPSSSDIKITGTGSIYVSATAVKVVSLEGDAEDPGFTTYYGTDVTGAKGWYAVSDALDSSGNIAKSTDAAGVTSFDLVDLADSGTGTALVKITRDAKGRVSGTSAATTTDLAEGSNLYFTDARVRATALTGLSTATATPVTATDSVLVGVGKLQAQINGNAPLTQSGAYASRPAASAAAGVIYYATDVQEAYRSDGSTWTVIPCGGTEIGYAEITNTTTTTSATAVDIAGLSVTCKVGERPVMLSYGGAMRNSIAGAFVRVQAIANGFNTSNITVPGTGNYLTQTRETRVSGLTPGNTYTFKLQIFAIGGGSAQLYGDANDRPYLQVRTT